MLAKTMGMFAALLFVLTALIGCEPPEMGEMDHGPELAFDASRRVWVEGGSLPTVPDEVLRDGVLYRVDGERLLARGAADLSDLDASEVRLELAPGATPQPHDWVYVLGGGATAGHWRFEDFPVGNRFAWHGRVFDSRVGPDGDVQIRATGEVLSQVASTSVRYSPVLLELTLEHEDGSRTTVSTTEEHPFYLPDQDDYLPAGQIEVGAFLRTTGGGRARLVRAEREEGDFEVYNFEVEGEHNYFVGDGAVAVHNAKCGPKHHIATNKNAKAAVRGGPWTPRFKDIFDKAGMTLNDKANLVRVPGHKGPHPEAYHQAVFDRLREATKGLNGKAYEQALRSELQAIAKEAQTAGSWINKLLTKQ